MLTVSDCPRAAPHDHCQFRRSRSIHGHTWRPNPDGGACFTATGGGWSTSRTTNQLLPAVGWDRGVRQLGQHSGGIRHPHRIRQKLCRRSDALGNLVEL